MKNLCEKLGVLVAVLGIIGSVILAVFAGRVPDAASYSFDITYERDWGLTIAYLISGLIGTGIMSVIFLALSEVLERLENLELRFSNMASSIRTIGKKKGEPGDDEWKCPKCGRINANYTGTCACGERKLQN